jgi:TatD DNase family protein
MWYNFFVVIQMIIDTHCHVEYNNIPDFEAALEQIIDIMEFKVIISGYDPTSNIAVLKLAEKRANVFASIGFHPSEADNIKDSDFQSLKRQIKQKKVVAIGEIGLDYYWRKDNKEKQKKIFRKQLDIAAKSNKPVVIHNREATDDIYNILKEYNVIGIMHCFNETIDVAKQFINMGFLLGISGVITFKNTKQLKEVVKILPLEYIVLETDSPYLTPEPYRGRKNKPEYVKHVAEKIAEIKGIDEGSVIQKTTENAERLFDL